MPLQNFVDKVGPVVSAAWLNMVDVLSTSVFGNAATGAAARGALCSDAPLEVTNGGTGQRTVLGTMASFGMAPPQTVVATSSDTRLNVTTPTNHSQLQANLVAGTYLIDFWSWFQQSATGSVGINANLNYSGTFTNSGATYQGLLASGSNFQGGAGGPGYIGSGISATVGQTQVSLTSVNNTFAGVFYARASLVATGSGVLAFAWAQNTLSATITVTMPPGSILIARKVA